MLKYRKKKLEKDSVREPEGNRGRNAAHTCPSGKLNAIEQLFDKLSALFCFDQLLFI